jgi:hypothetical protein
MPAKVGRNDPCPCGSGLKSKKCCASNSAETELVSQVVNRFHERMGQGHRPDEASRLLMIEAMRNNGADPAYIYAFERTGLLVFQETMHLIPEDEMATWSIAYEEYASLHPRED